MGGYSICPCPCGQADVALPRRRWSSLSGFWRSSSNTSIFLQLAVFRELVFWCKSTNFKRKSPQGLIFDWNRRLSRKRYEIGSWLLWNVSHRWRINTCRFRWLDWPLTRVSRSGYTYKSNISKTVRLVDKVSTAHWSETIPNIANGTMLGDLDWPLSASRGFVSISWASCFILLYTIHDYSDHNSYHFIFSSRLQRTNWLKCSPIF